MQINESTDKLSIMPKFGMSILIGMAFVLLPFFALCYYSYPSSDDFCYAQKVICEGFWGAQADWYHTWTGRFASNFFCSLQNIHFDTLPRLHGLFSGMILLCLGLTTALAAKTLLNVNKPRFILLISMGVVYAYLTRMPVVYDLYWAPVIIYTMPLVMTIGLLGLLFSKTPFLIKTPLGILLAFLISGFNEVNGFLVIIIPILNLALGRKTDRSTSISVLLFCIIGTIIEVIAPGNYARSAIENSVNGPIFYNAIKGLIAASYTFPRIFIDAVNLPVIILLFAYTIVMIEAKRNALQRLISDRRKIIILGIASLYMIACGLLPLIVYGSPGPSRTQAISMLTFDLLLLLWAPMIGVKLSIDKVIQPVLSQLKKKKSLAAGLMALFAFLLICQNNVIEAYKDIAFGRAAFAKTKYLETFAISKKSHGKDVVLEPWPIVKSPKSLGGFLYTDSTHYVNRYFASIFGLQTIRIKETSESMKAPRLPCPRCSDR